MRAVVGVDLSDGSERAIAHAVALARHRGWPLTLALVDAVPEAVDALPPSMRIIAERYAAILSARLDEHRARLAEVRERWLGQGVELDQVVVDGYPDERLPKIAVELEAALIVVGSHGRTGAGRFLIGSVAERVARLSEIDVLIARGDAPDGGYQRVIIGTDFSAPADDAARHALPFLAKGARVELAHCWWLPGAAHFGEAAIGLTHDELHGHLERALRAAGERLHAALADRPDLELLYDLVPAAPSRGLAELAERRDADLVVVGSHGRRGLRRLVLGSVAETTIRHAPCSVLVAR